MADTGVSQPGVQLPPDGAGKITAAFPLTIAGQTVYVPATVLVDGNGNEIGGLLVDLLNRVDESLSELRRARLALELLLGETVDDETAPV